MNCAMPKLKTQHKYTGKFRVERGGQYRQQRVLNMEGPELTLRQGEEQSTRRGDILCSFAELKL